MPAPTNSRELVELLRQSGVIAEDRLATYLRSRRSQWRSLHEPENAANQLLADGLVSELQAQQLLRGKSRGFWINKYLVLESLGSGGMGQVLLCEQTPMSRLVAVKILAEKAPGALERFLREARAVAALDHPNIVRAIDIDHDPRFHFLVMEYVDGTNLQELVDKHGRLSVARACNYISQAAWGLQHAHDAGWIHRDVKPGNLLVDRSGLVKVFDMGLSRLTTDSADNLTRNQADNSILGTADYLAPEQSLPGQLVDSRADIYSLGATLYFLLAGQTPFSEGTVVQKIMAHQIQKPVSISSVRPGLPRDVALLIERMMDKSPARRPQMASEVAEALASLAGDARHPLEAGEFVEHCPRVRQLLQAPGVKSARLPKIDSPVSQSAVRKQPRLSRKLLVAGGAIAVLACAAIAGLVMFFQNRAETAVTKKTVKPIEDVKPNVVGEIVPGIVGPEEAGRHLNQICTVQMVVRSAGPSKNEKMLFLNSQSNYRSEGNFTVVVQKLDSQPDDIKALIAFYQNKTIRVKGQVTQYNDQRQIVLASFKEVEIISDPAKK